MWRCGMERLSRGRADEAMALQRWDIVMLGARWREGFRVVVVGATRMHSLQSAFLFILSLRARIRQSLFSLLTE